VLSSEKDGPGNATRVLALEEEGFGLAILESEDLAVATDVKLALEARLSASHASIPIHLNSESASHELSFGTIHIAELGRPYLSRVDLLAGESVVVGTHVDWLREYPPTMLVVDSMATLKSMGIIVVDSPNICSKIHVRPWGSVSEHTRDMSRESQNYVLINLILGWNYKLTDIKHHKKSPPVLFYYLNLEYEIDN
jgi:hypothetical protein